MKVIRCRPDSTVGPTTWFTGQAWIEELAVLPVPSSLRAHYVTFAPGARTFWHKHALGQVLYVTAGAGLVQRAGAPEEAIRAGDTVRIEPEEWHWHGAGAGSTLTHLAIQEAGADGVEAENGGPVGTTNHPTSATS